MNATAAQSIADHAKATAIFICILAALAGLMFGLEIGVISGTQQFIQHDFAFWHYAAFAAVLIPPMFWLVPETKNILVEHVERNLTAGKPPRQIGQ